jgi:hypothetical protein
MFVKLKFGGLLAAVLLSYFSCNNPSAPKNFVLKWSYPCSTALTPGYFEYGLSLDQKTLTPLGRSQVAGVCPDTSTILVPIATIPNGTATTSWFYVRACDISGACDGVAFARPQ